MKRHTIIFSMAFLATLSLHAGSLEKVRDAIRTDYLSAKPSDQAEQWATTIGIDGRWIDIDYDSNSRSFWQLEVHLDRLIDISLAYETSAKVNKALLISVRRGIISWFKGNFHNSNWWYTYIGIPRRLLALAYILDSDLTPVLRDSIDKAISIIDSNDFPARPGGDRIQVLSNHAKVLLWKRNYDAADKIFRKIAEEACVASFEEIMYDASGGPAIRNTFRPAGRGVQADMTFHHRGDRINSTLSYGLELPEYFSYWARLLADTDSRISTRAVDFVIDYYLDAVCRHLVCGRYFEPSIMNRELSRPGEGTLNPSLAQQLLEISNGYRANELRHLIAVQTGKVQFSASYAHHFWQSDYFVFSRPSFQTAVRIHSCRNANQEAAHNREGIRNHFRGDGACMLSVTGREYADIAPVFDFRMIPGATTPLLPYKPLSNWGPVQILDNPTTFAGAINDSLYGAVAFDFISPRVDLRARKAWFFFDNEYLCLGTGITSTTPDSIVTTVEQCLSLDSIMEQDDDGWFFHAGQGYHIIDGVSKAYGSIEHRHGIWGNSVEDVIYASDTMDANIFSLVIMHGSKPNGDAYAYAIVPGTFRPQEHNFKILHNKPGQQAAMSADGSVIYMIFYEPGTIETPVGSFGVEQPCMMMLRDNNLYVCDPTRSHYLLTVNTPAGLRKVLVPTALKAGTPVQVSLESLSNL